MASTPPGQRLADLMLGRPVLDFIAERRADAVPYRRIATDLRDQTAGELDVSDVTVRAWWLASTRPGDIALRQTETARGRRKNTPTENAA
jgi:hypothetical protein